MFYNVLWCSMMLYDVLCLKSILGFLLWAHTSGVSPVIFCSFNLSKKKKWNVTEALLQCLLHCSKTEIKIFIRSQIKNFVSCNFSIVAKWQLLKMIATVRKAFILCKHRNNNFLWKHRNTSMFLFCTNIDIPTCHLIQCGSWKVKTSHLQLTE